VIMGLRILDLPKQFRLRTSIIYPPFKCGRYMEEFFYDYVLENKDKIETDYVYIPIFWTNLQNHPGFKSQKRNYELILEAALKKYPNYTKFFTVVQHDDGPQLRLPIEVNMLVFGACTGDIPLPLIYEDTNNTLLSIPSSVTSILSQPYLASFVGSQTNSIRKEVCDTLTPHSANIFLSVNNTWSPTISKSAADLFIEKTLASKFCLAPRGYGRSSFRFFEAMLLDRVPVYFWDDKEWLPYREHLDYSKFAVSIHITRIEHTYDILKNISDETYLSMLTELRRVRHWFTLDGMSEYIISKIY
jgi:hypothetical protein